MRRIETRHRSRHYYVKTPSLDDVEVLCEAASKLGFTASLSDERYEFDSLQDVIENRGENVTTLDLVLISKDANNIVMLSFAPFVVSASALGTSPGVKALWTEIDSILSPLSIRFYALHSPAFWGGVITGSVVLNIGLIFFVRHFDWNQLLVPGFAVLCFLFSIWEQRATPALFLDRDHKKTNFWRRNADKVILLSLGAVVSLVLKAVYDYLTK
ncbi:MAG: hypothetical protein KAS73_11480 [Candidatus Sabulitectum sp.]|nr:hypothetical protein [Candidatus Sabulitectum sp.]